MTASDDNILGWKEVLLFARMEKSLSLNLDWQLWSYDEHTNVGFDLVGTNRTPASMLFAIADDIRREVVEHGFEIIQSLIFSSPIRSANLGNRRTTLNGGRRKKPCVTALRTTRFHRFRSRWRGHHCRKNPLD